MKSSRSCRSSELTKLFMFFYLISTKVLLRNIIIPILQLRKPGPGRYLGQKLAAGSWKSQRLGKNLACPRDGGHQVGAGLPAASESTLCALGVAGIREGLQDLEMQ